MTFKNKRSHRKKEEVEAERLRMQELIARMTGQSVGGDGSATDTDGASDTGMMNGDFSPMRRRKDDGEEGTSQEQRVSR